MPSVWAAWLSISFSETLGLALTSVAILAATSSATTASLAPLARVMAKATTGSPLLEGATVTVGGANLLQRVAASISRLGGSILYTQVDLQGLQSKDGFVSVTVNCEVEQPALQKLLYDLEAGMPFLFVDQLVAQGPASPGTTPEGKLRVLISVSGQWQGSK